MATVSVCYQRLKRDEKFFFSFFLPTSSNSCTADHISYTWETQTYMGRKIRFHEMINSVFKGRQSMWSDWLEETHWSIFSSFSTSAYYLRNILNNQVLKHHTDCTMFLCASSASCMQTRNTLDRKSSDNKRKDKRSQLRVTQTHADKFIEDIKRVL